MHPLYVVCCYNNPLRFHRRLELHRKFQAYLAQFADVIPCVGELAYGERPFEVTEASNPYHLQLRTHEILWHKENVLNLLVQRIPEAKYIAWVDADITFAGPNWASET